MLICCDCGKLLEEDELSEYKEFDDAWGYETYITHKCCPYCGSGSLAETTLIAAESISKVIMSERKMAKFIATIVIV